MNVSDVDRWPAVQPVLARAGGAGVERPGAWWIGGDDVRTWLRVLAGFPGPQKGEEALQLFVLPRSAANRDAVGLVVLSCGEGDGLGDPGGDAVATALRRVGNVLLPMDAAFDPPMTSSEVDRVFPMHLHVLHPRLGHVGFEAQDAVGVADLLGEPALLSGTWGAAIEGPGAPDSMGPFLAKIDEEELRLFESEGQATIGVEPIDKLLGRGPKDAARRVFSGDFSMLPMLPMVPMLPMMGLAKGAMWFAGIVPSTADKATWVNHMADWAEGMLGRSLGSQRDREIERLMKLLREDPDRGLRFALPLDGDGLESRRGAGSGGLSERDAEFDLQGLGGTRGVDSWDMGWEARRDLEALYRARAMEDAVKGSHRRAAYIYAHLLGEMEAAAKVLESGGHFREAAALWNDRIDQPAEAARCLESAGLFEEALAIYRDRSDHLAEAKMLERLDRLREARVAWERALDAAMAREEPLEAARILESHLGCLEDAVELLRGCWPGGPSALECLDAWFALCDRTGRVGELVEWVEHERTRALVATDAVPLLERLGVRCALLRRDEVRKPLEDALRCAVGGALLAGTARSPQDLHSLMGALRPLHGDDLLFGRDLNRYRSAAIAELALEERKQARKRKRPPGIGSGEIVETHRFRGPSYRLHFRSLPIEGDSDGLLVTVWNVKNQEYAVERWNWDGEVQESAAFPRAGPIAVRAAYLPKGGGRKGHTVELFSDIGAPIVFTQPRRRASSKETDSLRIGVRWPMRYDVLDTLSTGAGEDWVLGLDLEMKLHLVGVDADNNALQDEVVSAWKEGEHARIGVIGRAPAIFCSHGVYPLAKPLAPQLLHVDGPLRLAVSPKGLLGRTLLVDGESVQLFSEDSGQIVSSVVVKAHDARAHFLRNGVVVVAEGSLLRAFRTQDQRAHPIGRLELTAQDCKTPLHIVSGPRIDEFAVFWAEGAVTVHRVVE